MSPGVEIAIIVTIPSVLTIVSGWVTAHRTGKIESKVDEVHDMANDRLSKALEKIERLSLLVERQRVEIKDNKEV